MGWILLIAVVVWVGLVVLGLRARALSLRGDLETGLVMVVVRLYARLYHGLRVRGKANIPPRDPGGPLVVISNHSAGVDPLLIQSVCPFEVRWVMAEDMRLPRLEPFWKWGGVIFVDRKTRSTRSVRTAIGHLKSGGVLGLFPEAQIERPARRLLPFHSGIGAFVRQSGARVLPVIIEGTPTETRSAWGSLFRPSRSRIRVMPAIDFAGTDLSPAEIAESLHERYLEWTGWPAGEPGPAYADPQSS